MGWIYVALALVGPQPNLFWQASDYSTPDGNGVQITYTVEISTNLTSWQALGQTTNCYFVTPRTNQWAFFRVGASF